jgi:hypothetical protein
VAALPLREVILSEATAHLVVRAGRRLPEGMLRMLGWLAENLVAFRAAP